LKTAFKDYAERKRRAFKHLHDSHLCTHTHTEREDGFLNPFTHH